MFEGSYVLRQCEIIAELGRPQLLLFDQLFKLTIYRL